MLLRAISFITTTQAKVLATALLISGLVLVYGHSQNSTRRGGASFAYPKQEKNRENTLTTKKASNALTSAPTAEQQKATGGNRKIEINKIKPIAPATAVPGEPSPTPDPDPIVNCTSEHTGIKQMRRSECETSVACEIGGKWVDYPSKKSCNNAQEEYWNNYYANLPTATPWPTFTPWPTATPWPTFTPWPTLTPLPTNTPVPTPTPVPYETWYVPQFGMNIYCPEIAHNYVESTLGVLTAREQTFNSCVNNTDQGDACLRECGSVYNGCWQEAQAVLGVNGLGDSSVVDAMQYQCQTQRDQCTAGCGDVSTSEQETCIINYSSGIEEILSYLSSAQCTG